MVYPSWNAQMRKELRKMAGDINVFITANSREAWGFDEKSAVVIEHGLDTDFFCPPYNYYLKKTLD